MSDETTSVVDPDSPDVVDGPEDEVNGATDAEPVEEDDGGTTDQSASPDDTEGETEKVGRLEREGDIAADYLEEFLDIADMDGDIDLDVEGDRAMVAVVGSNVSALVGSDGEVLEALQELTRLAVRTATGERSRLMLDIGGHRARRRQELVDLGERAVAEARSHGEPVRMEPMSSYERKVIHDVVAEAGLASESEGEEPGRRVVIRSA